MRKTIAAIAVIAATLTGCGQTAETPNEVQPEEYDAAYYDGIAAGIWVDTPVTDRVLLCVAWVADRQAAWQNVYNGASGQGSDMQARSIADAALRLFGTECDG